MSKSFEVYVGNLPRDVSNQQLRELFSPLGDVLNIWINRQFKTLTYAFVRFADEKTCNKACERFDNYELGLSKLKVGMSFKKNRESVLLDMQKKNCMTKSHMLKLRLLKDLRENRDIRESFKMAM